MQIVKRFIRMTPDPTVFGQGFNPQNMSEPSQPGFQNVTEEDVLSETDIRQNISLELAWTFSDLYKKLNSSLEFALRYGFGPAGKLSVDTAISFSKSLKQSSQSMSLIFKGEKELDKETINIEAQTRLTDLARTVYAKAAASMEQDDIGAFLKQYGEEYINQRTYGCGISVVLTFLSINEEVRRNFSNTSRIDYDGSAQVTVNATLEKEMRKNIDQGSVKIDLLSYGLGQDDSNVLLGSSSPDSNVLQEQIIPPDLFKGSKSMPEIFPIVWKNINELLEKNKSKTVVEYLSTPMTKALGLKDFYGSYAQKPRVIDKCFDKLNLVAEERERIEKTNLLRYREYHLHLGMYNAKLIELLDCCLKRKERKEELNNQSVTSNCCSMLNYDSLVDENELQNGFNLVFGKVRTFNPKFTIPEDFLGKWLIPEGRTILTDIGWPSRHPLQCRMKSRTFSIPEFMNIDSLKLEIKLDELSLYRWNPGVDIGFIHIITGGPYTFKDHLDKGIAIRVGDLAERLTNKGNLVFDVDETLSGKSINIEVDGAGTNGLYFFHTLTAFNFKYRLVLL